LFVVRAHCAAVQFGLGVYYLNLRVKVLWVWLFDGDICRNRLFKFEDLAYLQNIVWSWNRSKLFWCDFSPYRGISLLSRKPNSNTVVIGYLTHWRPLSNFLDPTLPLWSLRLSCQLRSTKARSYQLSGRTHTQYATHIRVCIVIYKYYNHNL